MRTRNVLAAAVLGAVMASSAVSLADSKTCGNGEVSPETTPAGIGVDSNGSDPTGGSGEVDVCNNGAVVPVAGSVTAFGSALGQTAYVDADGDPSNAALADCGDGFNRVMVNSAGPHLYSSPDGNYADTNPSKKGKQRALEKSPDGFVMDLTACTPAP
jgi:hypothetical protein